MRMKKCGRVNFAPINLKMVLAFMVVMTGLIVASRIPARAEYKKTYLYAVRMDSSSQAGQMKMLFEKGLKAVAERTGYDVKYLSINDDETFTDGVKKEKYDFIYSWNTDIMIDAIQKYGYTPVLTYTDFGVDSARNCLFAKTSLAATNVNGLRGKVALITDNFMDYAIVRKIVGDKPEDFFGKLKANQNFFSFFYSLSLGDAEVIIATEETYEFYRKNNPGPVQNVKKIACGPDYPRLWVLKARKTPKEIVQAFIPIMSGAGKDEAFKEYWPLMRMAKLKIYPIGLNEYKPLFDLVAEAGKKGWKTDYRRWVNIQKEN